MAVQQATKGSRKRSRKNTEEDKQSYYDRLLYQCRKDINKEAKRVKQFETQKWIRNHKKQQQQQPRKAGDSKLDELKAYDSLEPVIQESFRRLGILALNPDDSSSPPPTSSPSCWITDRILQHKRMRHAIDKWHEEVTNYRRWCLQQQEREERRQQGIKKPAATILPKSSIPSYTTNDTPEDMQQASVFLKLGSDDAEIHRDDAEDGRKRNRKGQRARRAKAIALEARRQGRSLTREQSLNWRPKKKREEVAEEPDAAMVEVKPEEPLHPSWQARKEQKQTIVAFEGKKITF